MSEARFHMKPTAGIDDDFDIGISKDGKAFTLSFGELQADVGSGKSPEMVAARVFSLVLPMDGAGKGYESKASARSSIESLQRNAPDAKVDDQTRS